MTKGPGSRDFNRMSRRERGLLKEPVPAVLHRGAIELRAIADRNGEGLRQLHQRHARRTAG